MYIARVFLSVSKIYDSWGESLEDLKYISLMDVAMHYLGSRIERDLHEFAIKNACNALMRIIKV